MSGDLEELTTQSSTLDELNDKIVDSINGYVKSNCKSVKGKEAKLSEGTFNLIADRLKLIKDGKRDSRFGFVQQMSRIEKNTKSMGKCSDHIVTQKRGHNKAGELSTYKSSIGALQVVHRHFR